MLEVNSHGHHKLNQSGIHDEYALTWITISHATAHETPYGYMRSPGHTHIRTCVTYLYEHRKHMEIKTHPKQKLG
jgi:hypothetical protein